MTPSEPTIKATTPQDFKNKNYPDIKDIILTNIKIDQDTGCWNWQKCKDRTGYGYVRFNGKLQRVHRLSYYLINNPSKLSPIPKGLCVLHRCDVPACANPTHLFLGTHRDNMEDMVSKGRQGSTLNRSFNAGSANGRAKLNDSDVLEIVAMLDSGELTHKEISEKFGLGQGAIGYINTGHSWSHLTGRAKENRQPQGEVAAGSQT